MSKESGSPKYEPITGYYTVTIRDGRKKPYLIRETATDRLVILTGGKKASFATEAERLKCWKALKKEVKKTGEDNVLSGEERTLITKIRALHDERNKLGKRVFGYGAVYEVIETAYRESDKVRICLKEAIAAFVNERKNNMRSEKYIKECESVLEKFLDFVGNKDIAEIGIERLKEFFLHIHTSKKGRGGKTISPTTLRRYYVCVLSLYEKVIKMGYLKENPVPTALERSGLNTKKPSKPIAYTNLASMERMLYWTLKYRKDMLPSLVFACFGGLRPSEIQRLPMNLGFSILDDGRGEIRLSKDYMQLKTKGSNRSVFLSPEAMTWLNASGYQPRTYIKDGKEIQYVIDLEEETQRNNKWLKFLRELFQSNKPEVLGVDITSDSPIQDLFRHSFGTYLCALHGAGATSERMGNSTSVLREHYANTVSVVEANKWFQLAYSPEKTIIKGKVVKA